MGDFVGSALVKAVAILTTSSVIGGAMLAIVAAVTNQLVV